MNPPDLHIWDLHPREAVKLETRLPDRPILILPQDNRPLNTDTGIDVSVKCTTYHARKALSYASRSSPLLNTATAEMPCAFPHVPGFRSSPVLAGREWRTRVG